MSRAAFLVSNPRSSALRALNYSPQVERIRAAPKRRSVALSSLVEEFGPAYGTVFTRIDCAPEHGVELLSQSDVFAAEPRGRVIRRDSMARPERHDVKRRQMLIAGAGTLGENELYGRSILADSRLVGKCVGPDAMAVTFSDPEASLSLFAYAFLASATGVAAIRSTSYGTKILRFREDLLASLPIPRADDETVERVASLIRVCVESRERYALELQAARLVVEDLPLMREAHSMCSERLARKVLWSGPLTTLNAWNYASTGGALEFLLQKWPGRLSDVVPRDKIFRGGRCQRISCATPHGIDFLNQRDVFSIRPIPRRIVLPAIDPRLIYAPTFSLLVGGQGTLGEGEIFGQVALVSPDLAKDGITEHLLRIQPDTRSHAAVCYAFFSTLVGRRLLRSTGVGTKLLSLREDLALALPYPTLTPRQTVHILTHVEAASTARVTAAEAEAEAFRIIEEEVLPAWLA